MNKSNITDLLPENFPISDRICDWICIGFTLWTLSCHITVALEGSLRTVIMLFCIFIVLAVVIYGYTFQHKKSKILGLELTSQKRFSSLKMYRYVHLLGFLIGLIGIFLLIYTEKIILFWFWIVGLLLVAYILLFNHGSFINQPKRDSKKEFLLWVIALICVIFTFISHRPDADDAFYVNMAVAAADHPNEALLQKDTLHGIDGLPLLLTTYKVHAYELLNGALSFLTGIPAIYCFHWIFAAFFAFLVPLAFAKLFRLLIPRVWIWGVIVLIIILVSVGETHRWYGNFSFVRIWQGKSIFLYVFLPLIYSNAFKFSISPTIRNWVLLFSVQIAAVGCTSSAIWAAPVVSFTALACLVQLSFKSLKVFLIGVSSSFYVISLGLIIKHSVKSSLDYFDLSGDYQSVFTTVLGESTLFYLGLGSVLLAWIFCKDYIAKRFSITVPFILFLTVLNPFIYFWVSKNLTGPATWRSMWVLPIPIFLTFIFVYPLFLTKYRWTRVGGRAVFVSLLLMFVVFIPSYSGISHKNKVQIDIPKLKVPELPYKWAKALNKCVGPDAYVLAPPEINIWIPTFHHHAYPLAVRLYLDMEIPPLGIQNVAHRKRMCDIAKGTVDMAGNMKFFLKGIKKYKLRGICLRKNKYTRRIGLALKKANFYVKMRDKYYEIWLRRPFRS